MTSLSMLMRRFNVLCRYLRVSRSWKQRQAEQAAVLHQEEGELDLVAEPADRWRTAKLRCAFHQDGDT